MVSEITGFPIGDDLAPAPGMATHQNPGGLRGLGLGPEHRPEIAFPVADRDDPGAGADPASVCGSPVRRGPSVSPVTPSRKSALISRRPSIRPEVDMASVTWAGMP